MEKTKIEGRAGLEALVGKPLPAGPWHQLSFEEIVAFADATGDHQWIHVDRERALRESPFGAPIAHGYYTLSRIAGLFFEAVEVTGFSAVLNYGLDKVRFPAPMKEGARYRLSPTVESITEVKGGLEVVFKNTIELEGEAKPTCVAQCVFRYLG
ncbi:MaoC family dehydratase [Vulgatibacter incomptus]|uniref:Acyl dehydratase n=1 Tax=Vulgatibacter incomptus TaxID=1391653 RepID=A0A0K1PG43_9BACT|nr:MaoC family dehydratase [Vulgatibacter incomptus]AKU92386.1 Acyl dehydratase [Vulgatibacter incomptus]